MHESVKSNRCLNQKQLASFLSSSERSDQESSILQHVEYCEHCRVQLERLAGTPVMWQELKEHFFAKSEFGDSIDETLDDIELADQKRDFAKLKEMLGPTDDPKMLGRLGGYEVCGLIGRGSAGVVVKALDTRLNRYVAIKLLAPVYSNNGSSRRRFEREGRAIASVKDPNVIPIHTVGEFQGTPFIVMEYVPDGSLQQRIDRYGPLTTRETTCVAMHVARGLAAAHQRGIVHRDVKPANVLLERGVDSAMVTDFGLARVVDEATMTRSGAISGTPQYMSPEQAKGESVDVRSDLFSLGSVMYAACTGHSPFRAETVFGVIKRVCESEPRPIRELNPDIEEWLAAFVQKLHAKNKDCRFKSAEEVADLLAQELAHSQSPTLVKEPNRDWWDQRDRWLFSGLNWLAPTSIRSKRGLVATTAIATLALFILVLTSLLGSNPDSAGHQAMVSASSSMRKQMPPSQLLILTKQENEKLPKFKQLVETAIDVSNGGQLVLRTNLGRLYVSTHEKPKVELKLTHTVSAKDQETANKMFAATVLDDSLRSELARKLKLESGKDAAILVTFPTRKLTDQEIEKASDLDELKEQTLDTK